MNLKSLTILFLVIFVTISCGKEDEDNLENATSDEGGRCRLTVDSEVHCKV